MKQRGIIVVFALFAVVLAYGQQTKYQAYISKYRNIAIKQMREHGIPASITMAQGLLESAAGTSLLATKGHNHFGIKAHNDWTGPVMLCDDDAPNERFRVYAHDEHSYEDHSLFLRRGKRYASLFNLSITDYKGWAYGLKAAGYATNPNYAVQLIRIVENYNLTALDKEALGKHYAKTAASSAHSSSSFGIGGQREIRYNNRNYYIIARSGDTFESIAKEYGVSARRLRRNNEVDKHHKLTAGDIVYFEKKQTKAAKIYKKMYYTLKSGESLYLVSQKFGMRLKTLYSINKFSPDHTPMVGERIRLR